MTHIDAGVWLRVSSGGQDEANQVPDVEGYCEQRGYHIRKRYEVHSKSAYHGEQQKYLDQALADLRAGAFTVLVIWHSDRLERRPGKALLDVLAEFAAAGGRVESVQEPTLGQLDFGGQVTTFVQGLVNHEKSHHLSEQVRLAHNRSRANGALVGRPPWGYTTEGEKYGRRLVPTEEGRRLVPEVYARCAKGESEATIAAWLKAETGRDWWPRTIGHMVKNPVYKGRRSKWDVEKRTYGATLHHCEPLVEVTGPGGWDAANQALKTRPKRGPVLAENRAMLATAIFCPRCEGSPMYRIECRDSVYYRCSGRGPARKGCGNRVKLPLVDAAVSRIADRVFDAPVMVLTRIPGNDHSEELAKIEDERRDLAMRGLPWAEEDAERAKLRARYDEVAALPDVPEDTKLVDTGTTYAAQWDALAASERGPWLRSAGFRVVADKAAVKLIPPDWFPWKGDGSQLMYLLPPRDMLRPGRAVPTVSLAPPAR